MFNKVTSLIVSLVLLISIGLFGQVTANTVSTGTISSKEASELFSLAKIFFAGNNDEKALEIIEKLTEEYPDERTLVAMGIDMASLIHIRNENISEAIDSLWKLYSFYGNEGISGPYEGEQAYSGKTGAIALERLIQIYSGESHKITLDGLLRALPGYKDPALGFLNVDRAMELCHRMIREFAGETQCFYEGSSDFDIWATEQIIYLIEKHNHLYEKVVQEYEQIIKESKSEKCKAIAYAALGEANEKNKKILKAIEEYRKIIEQFPFDYSQFYDEPPKIYSLEALEKIALIYLYELKDRKKAFEVYKEAAQILTEFKKRYKSYPPEEQMFDRRIQDYLDCSQGINLPPRQILDGSKAYLRFGFSWHPSGEKILYVEHDYNVYEKNINTNEERFLFDGVASWPVWSPDGKKIMFYFDGELLFYDAIKKSKYKITDKNTDGGMYGPYPCWSPDSNFISYIDDSKYKEEHYLTIMNLLDRTKTKYPLQNVKLYKLQWSPKGSEIICLTEDKISGEYDIGIFSLSDGKLRQLNIKKCGHHTWVSWSPNGKYIAFSSARVKDPIFVFSIQDNSISEIKTWSDGSDYLSWSPEGDWILFTPGWWDARLVEVPEKFR